MEQSALNYSMIPLPITFFVFKAISVISFLVILVIFAYSFFLKDELKKKWFKAKKYGFGWYPATLNGWLTIFVYIIYFISNIVAIDSVSFMNNNVVLNEIPWTLFVTLMLVVISYNTGEKARWRWGK